MANRRGKTPAQIEKTKQIRRIKQAFKRLESRGYTIETKFKEKLLTKTSAKKLQEIGAKDLYKKATYTTEQGKTISGTERRTQERQLAGRKSAETRRKRIEEASRQSVDFEQRRREQDKYEQERLKTEQEFRQKFEQGRIVYGYALEAIEKVDIGHKRAAEHLKQVLDEEINKYGFDVVMRDIADTEQQFLTDCDLALRYNPGHPVHDGAIRDLEQLFRGALLTSEEARELQLSLENDDYFNSLDDDELPFD